MAADNTYNKAFCTMCTKRSFSSNNKMVCNIINSIILLLLFLILSCGEKKEHQQIKLVDLGTKSIIEKENKKNFKMPEYRPFIFEFEMTNYDGISKTYSLTNDSLFIYSYNNSDSPIFSTNNIDSNLTAIIENLNIYELETDFISPGIKDGLMTNIYFTKQESTKTIRLHNYYHKIYSPVIEMINHSLPKKHQFWYDKDWLLKYTLKQ